MTPPNVPTETNQSTVECMSKQSSILPHTSTFSSIQVRRSAFTSIESDSNTNEVCSCCTSHAVQTNHAIIPPFVSTESSAVQTESHGHKRKHNDVSDQNDTLLSDNDALELTKLTAQIQQYATATISKAFPSAKQSRMALLASLDHETYS